jgi:hypothetical protein
MKVHSGRTAKSHVCATLSTDSGKPAAPSYHESMFCYNEQGWLPAIRTHDESQGRSENLLNINLSKTPQKCGRLSKCFAQQIQLIRTDLLDS